MIFVWCIDLDRMIVVRIKYITESLHPALHQNFIVVITQLLKNKIRISRYLIDISLNLK